MTYQKSSWPTQKKDYGYNNLVFQTHYVLELHKQLPIIL